MIEAAVDMISRRVSGWPRSSRRLGDLRFSGTDPKVYVHSVIGRQARRAKKRTRSKSNRFSTLWGLSKIQQSNGGGIHQGIRVVLGPRKEGRRQGVAVSMAAVTPVPVSD